MAIHKFVYFAVGIFSLIRPLAGKNSLTLYGNDNEVDYEVNHRDYVGDVVHYGNEQNETINNGLNLFCYTMNVAKVNCTCAKFPEVCDFVVVSEQFNNNRSVTTVYHCDSMYNTIRAGFSIFGASLGIIGNGAVVVVTIINWEQGTRYNQLIIGLAITDFLFSFNQLIISIPLFWTCKWVYADVMCKVLSASVDMSVSIAMGFILIIALERYVGILYPFSNGLTQTKFWIIVSLNIVLGVMSIIPMLMYINVGEYRICRESWPNPNYSLMYSWTMLIMYFLLPVLLTLIMYFRIIRKLHTTRLMFGKQNSALGEHSTTRRIKDNRRIMAILISVLILFVMLVLPNKLVWILLDYFSVHNLSKGTYRIMNLFGMIPYSFHVCVNPIIYSFVDSKFRTKMINMCCMRYTRKVSFISSGRTRTDTKLTTTKKL